MLPAEPRPGAARDRRPFRIVGTAPRHAGQWIPRSRGAGREAAQVKEQVTLVCVA